MPTLAEFLLQRISEDEASAGDPGRRNEKRQVVELLKREIDPDWKPVTDPTYRWNGTPPPHKVLRLLAVPYAEHPEYRDEWSLWLGGIVTGKHVRWPTARETLMRD